MTVECRIKPEIRAAVEREFPAALPPVGLGLLHESHDEYIVTGGAIIGADLAGRFFNRVPAPCA
ncbi:hypothetical protein [Streptomyces collinus]|uniref:hypothetical protein n=1 Tax=Streptomyces collinus TaxID=42684 RepID=UPI0029425955|nr:hypothetical protein [Streptomyces collinus]